MLASADGAVVRTLNAQGASPFVIVCDHASNVIPERYGDMGLTQTERDSHIAWDPGALAVGEALSASLDAPLVYSTISRLVIDTNRRLSAKNLFWTLSEATPILANVDLSAAEREHRIAAYYTPFHDAIDDVLDQRMAMGRQSVLVCLHTFTPVFLGVMRPWQIGIIHGREEAFSRHLHDALVADNPRTVIGWNEPYSAQDGVTETLERHGDVRGYAGTMIEVVNSQIEDAQAAHDWADMLAKGLIKALGTVTQKGRG